MQDYLDVPSEEENEDEDETHLEMTASNHHKFRIDIPAEQDDT